MKARTFIWYIKRPSFWPYMVEELRRKYRSRERVGNRDLAAEWCRENCSSRESVSQWLGLSIVSLPKQIKQEAQSRAAQIPMLMGGEGDIDMIHSIVSGLGLETCIESGVSMGWSSLAILAAFETFDGDKSPDRRLVSVDMPYPNRNNEPFVGVCVPDSLCGRWTLIRVPDRWGLRDAISSLKNPVDFYHYDSDKTYWGRLFAWKLVRPQMKKGSIFMMDDIDDNYGFREIIKDQKPDNWRIYKIAEKFVGIIRV